MEASPLFHVVTQLYAWHQTCQCRHEQSRSFSKNKALHLIVILKGLFILSILCLCSKQEQMLPPRWLWLTTYRTGCFDFGVARSCSHFYNTLKLAYKKDRSTRCQLSFKLLLLIDKELKKKKKTWSVIILPVINQGRSIYSSWGVKSLFINMCNAACHNAFLPVGGLHYYVYPPQRSYQVYIYIDMS